MRRTRLLIFVLRVLGAAAAAGLAIATTAITLKTWTPSANTGFVIACLAAGLALLSTSSSAWNDYRGRKRRDFIEHVDLLVQAAFWNIFDATKTKISPKDLGIAVYKTGLDHPRRYWRQLTWLPFRLPWLYWKLRRLNRVIRHRPRNHNETTGIVWRPGKGVIGISVQKAGVAHSDVQSTWEPHRGCSEDDWNRLTPEVRQGMSFPEFLSLIESGKRLGVVVASPILREGQAIGCVAVDGPTGEASYKALTSDRVKTALADAASAIEKLL